MNVHYDAGIPFPTSGNVRIWQVAQFLSVSEATVKRRTKDPRFPQPLHLSSRLVVFDAAEVRRWNETISEHHSLPNIASQQRSG